MPGVSIHVVDVSCGVVAAGMKVELFSLGISAPHLIVAGTISDSGVLAKPELDQRFDAGYYETRFHVAAYYRDAGVAMPIVPFLNIVTFQFGISDPHAHYHLPMKCTPWGYSCFRG